MTDAERMVQILRQQRNSLMDEIANASLVVGKLREESAAKDRQIAELTARVPGESQ